MFKSNDPHYGPKWKVLVDGGAVISGYTKNSISGPGTRLRM